MVAVVVLLIIGVAGLVGAIGHRGGGSNTGAEGGRHEASSVSGAPSNGGAGGNAATPATPGSVASPAPGAISGTVASGSTGSSSLPALPAGSTGQSTRVEETGTLALIVPGSQIQPDIGRLTSVALGAGGFVANSETQSATPGSPGQGMVTLQVPEPGFQSVLDQVQGLGKVSSLATKATDVTGQYVDLQARITALENSRQQYLTIMTRATTVGDVLSVQQQLDNLQSQLEQLQGQLQVLDNETTYATLTVTLSQRLAPGAPKPESGLVSAWHGAMSGFVAGIEGLVRVAGPLLFAALLLLALVLLGRWAWHLRRQGPRRPGTPAITPGA